MKINKIFIPLFLLTICIIVIILYMRITVIKFNFDDVTYIEYSWHGKSKRLLKGTEEYNMIVNMILSSEYKFRNIKFFSKSSEYIFNIKYKGNKSNELFSLNGNSILQKGQKYYNITLNNIDFDYLKKVIIE